MLHVKITYKEYRIPKPRIPGFFKPKAILRMPFLGAGSPSASLAKAPQTSAIHVPAEKPRSILKPVVQDKFPKPSAYVPNDPVKHLDHLRFDKSLEAITFDLKNVEKAATLLSVILADVVAEYPNHFVPPDEASLLEALKEDPAIYELLKDCHRQRGYQRVRRLSKSLFLSSAWKCSR